MGGLRDHEERTRAEDLGASGNVVDSKQPTTGFRNQGRTDTKGDARLGNATENVVAQLWLLVDWLPSGGGHRDDWSGCVAVFVVNRVLLIACQRKMTYPP